MMTDEELSDIRTQLKILEARKTPEGDCPLLYPGCECGRSKLLSHIDEQASQIVYWQKCYNDLVDLNAKEEGACKLALGAKDRQIVTLKAICIKERFWQIWNAGECQTVERATQKAKDQLAKEYPEIFAEE